jgi:UDP-N-acetylmuramoylalanine--D-glutamate ligase
MKKNVRALVLIGALTERLHAEAVKGGLMCPIERCQTLEEAVARGYVLAKEHGAKAVLLSPACSSYDMFKSYGQRGDVFAAAARNL